MLKTPTAIMVAPNEMAIDLMEIPEPGEHQVIVKQIATGVCLSQVHQLKTLSKKMCPQLLGHGGIGQVSHVGKNVTHLKEGDWAITTWVPRAGYPGRDFIDGIVTGAKFRGELAQGPLSTYSEDCLTSDQLVVKIDPKYGKPENSIVGCAILTGAGAVFHTAKVRAQQSVVVIGAGGIGLSSIKMSSLMQAYPIIAVDINDEKLEFAKKWGATHTINSTKEDLNAKVWDITKTGADFAFDAVGLVSTHEAILPMVRSGGPGGENVGGMAVLIGWPQAEFKLNAEHFVYHQRQYRGSHGAAIPDIDFPMYLRLSEEGLFPLDKLVTKSYKLEDAQTAIDDLENGRITGRALIKF
ncbi:MAG: alcohol dehydrogenase/S-(hydroxymethyl)glutathione dehydrogenase / alcohol dehydrogenase [Chloroflexi bacterium]|nr:MAG: alcohol dehydrogenase/S-(hydroxymethyl)glutathione dehydrogenase / alcohol dehydrogenase [Chloroflexota bacterium]